MNARNGLVVKELFLVLVALLLLLLLAPLGAHAQQKCTQRAVVAADADVYRAPPRFVTGAGWQGDRVDQLAHGTQVLKCTERSVPFGLSTKTWSQVAYQRGGAWQYGWILDERTRAALSGARGPATSLAKAPLRVLEAIVPSAQAAPAVVAANLPLQDSAHEGSGAPAVAVPVASEAAAAAPEPWRLPESAPFPSSDVTARAPAIAKNLPDATPNLGELIEPYWPLFLAMVLGMVAKAIVDVLDAELRRAVVFMHLRRGVVALLVSPIVFLGFLSSGEFEVTLKTFLVLLLLAFQNGFFWQTLLKREGAEGKVPVKAGPAH